MNKQLKMGRKAMWEVAKYEVEGRPALRLDVERDPRFREGTDEDGRPEFTLPIHEWSIPCRKGEIHGLATARQLAPFRGCVIWELAAANLAIQEFGLRKTLRRKGEELQFEVPDGKTRRLLEILEPVASVQIAKKIMNEIAGRYDQFSSLYDAETNDRAEPTTKRNPQ